MDGNDKTNLKRRVVFSESKRNSRLYRMQVLRSIADDVQVRKIMGLNCLTAHLADKG